MFLTLIRRELLDNLMDVSICGSCRDYAIAGRCEYRCASLRTMNCGWQTITPLPKPTARNCGKLTKLIQMEWLACGER